MLAPLAIGVGRFHSLVKAGFVPAWLCSGRHTQRCRVRRGSIAVHEIAADFVGGGCGSGCSSIAGGEDGRVKEAVLGSCAIRSFDRERFPVC